MAKEKVKGEPLDLALAQRQEFLKRWNGKVSVASAVSDEQISARISTGLLSLDYILGGGIACGRLHEFFGDESSGKTSQGLVIGGNAQKQFPEKFVGLIDVEHSFDPRWGEACGLDLDRLLLHQPDNALEALSITKDVIQSGLCSLVILDSIAALISKIDWREEEAKGEGTAALARMLSESLKELVTAARKSNTAVYMINQVRINPRQLYGDPTYSPGGAAVKFYPSIRVLMHNSSVIKDAKDDKFAIGHTVHFKCVKNKTSRPRLETKIDFLYDEGGFSREGDIFDLAFKLDLFNQSGSWITFIGGAEEIKFQGRSKWINEMRTNSELLTMLTETVKSKLYA